MPLPIATFTAWVDPTQFLALRDEDVLPGGGLEAEMGVNLATPFTDAFAFDGWVPTQVPPPSPTISVRLPASRAGHAFQLYPQPASANTTPWPAGTPPMLYPWPAPAPALQTETYAGVAGMADYPLASFTLTLANPTPYDGGPFTLQDGATLAPHDVRAGLNDLRGWLLAAEAVELEVSTSRWEHHLQVRQPNGEAYDVTHATAAGSASVDRQRVIEEVSYHYFDAVSQARPELPWYLEDLDTGERLGFPAGQRRPSNDALILWIAVAAPQQLSATGGPGRRGSRREGLHESQRKRERLRRRDARG